MTTTPVQKRLAHLRLRARTVLWVENLGPALWPAAGLLGAAAAAALFDLPAFLPIVLHWVLLAVIAAGCGWLAWRGLRAMHRPTESEIDRRLERNGGVAHRPLAVLDDQPANLGTDGAALWQAHVRRAADQVGKLRAGWPQHGLERVDQYALRGLLFVALAAGLVVAGPDAPNRLLHAVAPVLPTGVAAPEPLLQAWVTPPSYTGLPPLFLRTEDSTVSVPAGSHLTVSLTGGTGQPTLSLATDTQDFKPLDAASWQAEREVGQGGALVVTRRGRVQGHWVLAIIPDEPPGIAWADPPGGGKGNQRRLQTRLPWTAADDYGVVSLQAELRLRDRPAADPLMVTIPLPGDAPKQAKGVQAQDLTANPWAGLPVIATLIGKDAPGQRGTSEPAEFILPERSFKNPLARAVIDIRKRLTLAPEDHAQAAADLSALADAPEAFDNNTAVFLVLSSTATLLAQSGAPANVTEAQQRLWALALQLEDDAVSRTAQAVQAARDALKQSADPNAPKNQPTEMDRKAEALRQAIQKHLQALAEKARRDGTMMPFDPRARTLNQRDFDKLTREMQEAARAGRMDEARDKMAQLERMLEQLKQAEANPGDRRQAQQQRQKGRQQMGAAEDMVQRETGLKQHTQDRADPEQRTPDAAQQRALRRALGEMMQQFGDLTGKVPDELSNADLAMRDAAGALAAGKDPDAATAEQRAIDALQKGEQQMSQQMASSLGISVQPGEGEGNQPGGQMSQGDGSGDGPGDGTGDAQADGYGDGRGDQEGDGGPGGQANTDNEPRDPLGRPTRDGSSGRAEGGNVHVPEEMERARTRDLQAELRRRGADRTRPAGELDYINRLLKSF